MTHDPHSAERLRAIATEARGRSYAPYSGFDAGAAVLGSDGQVYTGSVIENISLGLAMCAERVALFSCASAGARPMMLTLVAPRTDGGLTLPCGACLQVALELGGPDLAITAVGDVGEYRAAVIDLLPRGPHRKTTGVKTE